jgi:hypothetical protein
MALSISLSVSIATTRTTGVLTDATTYGTGGNPARSAVGVFVTGYRVDAEGNLSEITVEGSDPETDVTWTFEIPEDGSLKFLVSIIPDFDSDETYDQYEAVFRSSDNKVFRSKQDNRSF